MACWQWNNFLEQQCPIGKTILHINMDESCVRMHCDSKAGFVVVPSGHRKKHVLRREMKVGLRQRRSAVTLVAFICDDFTIQKHLPQIIIGNEMVLLRRDELQLQEDLPANWFLRRRKSGWLNSDELINIIKLLGEIMKPLQPQHHIILSMDASPVHLTRTVAAACAGNGLHLMFIPASMTPWLQPCDTHLFAKYKRALGSAYQAAQATSATGEISALTHLRLVIESGKNVIETQPWRPAFLKTGLCEQQRGVSQSLLERIGMTAPPPVPHTLPSLVQLQSIYRTGASIPITTLFRLFLPRSEPLARPVRALAVVPNTAILVEHPWAGRLRSSSRLNVEPQETQVQESPRFSHAVNMELSQGAESTGSACDRGPAAVAGPRATRLLPWPRRPRQ